MSRERFLENPFYVLGVRPSCTRAELEREGMVRRIVYPEVPPRVEYTLTEWGQALCPALDALLKWKALRDGAWDERS